MASQQFQGRALVLQLAVPAGDGGHADGHDDGVHHVRDAVLQPGDGIRLGLQRRVGFGVVSVEAGHQDPVSGIPQG